MAGYRRSSVSSSPMRGPQPVLKGGLEEARLLGRGDGVTPVRSVSTQRASGEGAWTHSVDTQTGPPRGWACRGGAPPPSCQRPLGTGLRWCGSDRSWGQGLSTPVSVHLPHSPPPGASACADALRAQEAVPPHPNQALLTPCPAPPPPLGPAHPLPHPTPDFHWALLTPCPALPTSTGPYSPPAPPSPPPSGPAQPLSCLRRSTARTRSTYASVGIRHGSRRHGVCADCAGRGMAGPLDHGGGGGEGSPEALFPGDGPYLEDPDDPRGEAEELGEDDEGLAPEDALLADDKEEEDSPRPRSPPGGPDKDFAWLS
ncbi:hypothetical protein H8959_022517 [Pygathrix nigripes]